MLRYENEGIGVSVKLLHTDYATLMLANWNNEKKVYECKLYIKREDFGNYNLVDEGITIDSAIKDIKFKMAKFITDKFNADGFEHDISNYEYEVKCFDIGDNQ